MKQTHLFASGVYQLILASVSVCLLAVLKDQTALLQFASVANIFNCVLWRALVHASQKRQTLHASFFFPARALVVARDVVIWNCSHLGLLLKVFGCGLLLSVVTTLRKPPARLATPHSGNARVTKLQTVWWLALYLSIFLGYSFPPNAALQVLELFFIMRKT